MRRSKLRRGAVWVQILKCILAECHLTRMTEGNSKCSVGMVVHITSNTIIMREARSSSGFHWPPSLSQVTRAAICQPLLSQINLFLLNRAPRAPILPQRRKPRSTRCCTCQGCRRLQMRCSNNRPEIKSKERALPEKRQKERLEKSIRKKMKK